MLLFQYLKNYWKLSVLSFKVFVILLLSHSLSFITVKSLQANLNNKSNISIRITRTPHFNLLHFPKWQIIMFGARHSILMMAVQYEPLTFKRQHHKMVKHTQTIRRLLPTNCLRVFDHFVGLAFNGLNILKTSPLIAETKRNISFWCERCLGDHQSHGQLIWETEISVRFIIRIQIANFNHHYANIFLYFNCFHYFTAAAKEKV